MAFPGRNYAPPGVYTQTFFENPISTGVDNLKVPVFIGEGNEYLVQNNLEVVRGSSSSIDQRVFKEDMTGRAVVDVSATGVVTLGDFNCELTKVQVRNYPIVNGDGTGTTTFDRSDVAVIINGVPTIVLSVDGTTGIVEIVSAPEPTDDVRVTYFFNRTDTRVTDEVSEQVTAAQATIRGAVGIGDEDAPDALVPPQTLDLHGDVLNNQGVVIVGANNVLILTVDGTENTIEIPPRPDYTMAQVAASINAFNIESLVASRFTNNFGKSTLLLTADRDIAVGNGSINTPLGLITGDVSARARTFYTFNGPIVDGSNGGVTTTDTADVTVKVDGLQIIPTSVNGSTRAVTLPFAPEAGATVTVAYWFNTWQDTFDYLAHLNISEITQAGDVPNSSTFVQEADFILKNDLIHWGTSFLVETGVHTQGATFFGDEQISVALIDNRFYMSEATSVTDTTTGSVTASKTDFQLLFQPTLGNGRDTSLGQDLFQTVSNNRIDLPVNRPDVIDAYWGFSVQDALQRGPVAVTRVEGVVITLAEAVPVGATVYATVYHNLLTDNEYTLFSQVPDVSGVGTYTALDQGLNPVYGPIFDIGSKGASLTGIPINWPSGSELSSDLHFQGVGGNQFTGPVEEIVTVQFASKEATPAKYTAPGADLYEVVGDESDRANVYVDGAVLDNNGAGDAGLDMSNPSGHGAGFFASLVGDEIDYTGGTSATVGQTYDLTTNEIINLEVDGVLVQATVPAATNVTAQHIVDAINENAGGHQALATAGAVTSITLAATASALDDYYNGWTVVLGSPAAAAGEYRTVLDYDGATKIAIISTGATDWSGAPVATNPYYIYNDDSLSTIKGSTTFDGPVSTLVGEYDKLGFSYIGTAVVSGSLVADIGNGPFATALDMAAEVETQMNAAITVAVGGTPTLAGFRVNCVADPEGRLTFSIQLPGVDSAGFMAFIDGATVDEDFAIIAGLDTAATAAGGQAKLLQGEVARYSTPVTVVTTLLHDRVVLRNRILPGWAGSMSPLSFQEQMGLVAGSGSGLVKAGFGAGEAGEGHASATVTPASLVGQVGFAGGQGTVFGDARNHQPAVVFYDGTGANPANNVLAFSLDGVPVEVTFIASQSGTLTAVGPAPTAGSILEQIITTMSLLPGTPFGTAANIRDTLFLVRQEGAGIRISSNLSSVSSNVIIGSGSANASLGFAEGGTSLRAQVSARLLASALNSNRHTTFTTWMHDFSAVTANFFATDALAWIQVDAGAREYLFIQSNTLGAASAVQWRMATVAGVQTDDILFPVTGLLIPPLDSSTGEIALDGYFVISNNSNGAGSDNSSILNNGVGQDGVVGQTYLDQVTGLTFTILPRGFQDSPLGPWLAYPTGINSTFRINVSSVFTTNANIPNNALGGVELTVANTIGIGVGDTALVSTFERGGNEPAIGDVYNVSYIFTKDSYSTALFTRVSSIEAAYGEVSPDNPVSLASVLAILNGAVLVGIKQVPREGQGQASLESYRDAIEELEGTLPGEISLDIITPLRGDSLDLYQFLKRSNVRQSSIRYRQERTSIVGVSGGTGSVEVQNMAQSLDETRMRVVYPDIATMEITDAYNNTKEHLVDGPMLAAMLVGSVVSPNLDVATPWTGRNLVGMTQLGRKLDAVEANQTAIRGVTVLVDKPPFIRVRQGFSTDMSSILTKTPTIVMIADEVQRQSRVVLENFVGIKNIPGIISQIEGRLAMLLKSMVAAQIIGAYTGISARQAPDDPTVIEIEAFYQPIFPLLYLVLTYHLRSSL